LQVGHPHTFAGLSGGDCFNRITGDSAVVNPEATESRIKIQALHDLIRRFGRTESQMTESNSIELLSILHLPVTNFILTSTCYSSSDHVVRGVYGMLDSTCHSTPFALPHSAVLNMLHRPP